MTAPTQLPARPPDAKAAPPKVLVSVPDAASMLSLSRRGVEILIGSGELPSVKIGRRRLIRRTDIDALIDRHLQAA